MHFTLPVISQLSSDDNAMEFKLPERHPLQERVHGETGGEHRHNGARLRVGDHAFQAAATDQTCQLHEAELLNGRRRSGEAMCQGREEMGADPELTAVCR